MTSFPVIIDCDPGIDDAVAILLALAVPGITLRGITTISGNLPVDRTARNARQVLDLAGRPDIPVHAGCDRPLIVPAMHGQYHGPTGLGTVELPPPSVPVANGHAAEFIVDELERALAAGEALTLCGLGPLTNLAVVLRMRPDLTPAIARIAVMGGAFREAGNRSLTSEFNILADPHAAEIVFSAGAPMICVPLDATHQAMATPERVDDIRALGGRVAVTLADMMANWDRKDLRRYGSPGGPLHDPLVVAALIAPQLFGTETARVFVEHRSPLTMGQTVADWYGRSGEPANVEVVTRVDAEGFFALLGRHLASYRQTEAA